MKLIVKPMLQCTKTEYQTEIEPIIKMLDEIDLCPHRNEKRNTTWNCEMFEDCCCCPFGQANDHIQDAKRIIKNIGVIV